QNRYGHLGVNRCNVDDGAAAGPVAHMLNGSFASMHYAPVVGIEQSPVLLFRKLIKTRKYYNPGIIDPGVKTSVMLYGPGSNRIHLLFASYIGHYIDSLSTLPGDFLTHLLEYIFIA